MIRKLRIRFIALAMCSLAVVLIAIVGTINLLNYREILVASDDIIDLLVQNSGSFPKYEYRQGQGKGKRSRRFISPETPYESRYFTVVLNENGQALYTDTGNIAAVDNPLAVEYAKQVASRDSDRGFIGPYRYMAFRQNGRVLAIFLDCTRSLATFNVFLLTSLAISLVGMLAVFILLLLMSGRIVRPVSESYERQKQFVTNAGHEIKTPITIIDADAEILEMEIGENQWLSDIRLQNKRLAALTNDLITLSRMEEAQKGLFNMIDFPISDVVAEMAEPFKSLAISQQKSFAADIKPMLTYRGDERSIRQLVSILLDNANKYCPASGSISISLDRQGRVIRLTVSNTADNISPAELPRLFDRFYRGDRSRSSQTGGYGIGLSIAKAIVTAHKGKITASTPDGDTLVMTVVLPG